MRVCAILQVYDVTKFLKLHPGGKKILLGVGGQECTEQFNQFHNATAVLAKYGPKLQIGELAGGNAAPSAKKAAAAAAAPAAQSTAVVATKKAAAPIKLPNVPYGELIPYGDPAWYAGWATPYYKDTHRNFRAALREVGGAVWPCCCKAFTRTPRPLRFFRCSSLLSICSAAVCFL